MRFAAFLALLTRLAPYRAELAFGAAVLLAGILAVLAIHLPSSTARVYPVAALAIVSFLLGFLGPKPLVPPL